MHLISQYTDSLLEAITLLARPSNEFFILSTKFSSLSFLLKVFLFLLSYPLIHCPCLFHCLMVPLSSSKLLLEGYIAG